MDRKRDIGRLISLPSDEFEALLERAAETGARRALHEVGLDGTDAAEDIRDLRSLLAGFGWPSEQPCRPPFASSPPAFCSPSWRASPSS